LQEKIHENGKKLYLPQGLDGYNLGSLFLVDREQSRLLFDKIVRQVNNIG
jgi:hypothetical protein